MFLTAAAFLRIRLLQLLREFRASGLFYAVVVSGAFIGLLFVFYHSQSNREAILYWFSFLALVVAMIHFNRADHRFLSVTVFRPYVVYISEYFFIFLLFALVSVWASGDPVSLLFAPVFVLIAFLKPPVRQTSTRFTRVLFAGRQNYEWKSGLRKSGIAMGLIWILALLLTPVPYASMLLVWFILLIVSSFYEQHETREMIESFELNEHAFLMRRTWQQNVMFLILVIPVALASLFFFPERWWIWILFIVFSLINVSVFVISKYSIWESGGYHRSTSLINSLCMVSFFVPFLLPLPLFILARNYPKAVNRLKPHLHDFHR